MFQTKNIDPSNIQKHHRNPANQWPGFRQSLVRFGNLNEARSR
jgi:hypothetical protein